MVCIQNFLATSFDDNILEVVAVFGSVQLGISRVINLQRHRIAQVCPAGDFLRHTALFTHVLQRHCIAWVYPPGNFPRRQPAGTLHHLGGLSAVNFPEI